MVKRDTLVERCRGTDPQGPRRIDIVGWIPTDRPGLQTPGAGCEQRRAIRRKKEGAAFLRNNGDFFSGGQIPKVYHIPTCHRQQAAVGTEVPAPRTPPRSHAANQDAAFAAGRDLQETELWAK